MTAKGKQLRATAHHEAGHAVAAVLYGLKFKYVTIKADGDSFGHVLLCRRRKQDPQPRIVVDFAGQLAEAKFRGRRPRYGMHGDNQSAVDVAYSACSSRKTAEAFLHYCWCSSSDFIDVRWNMIRAVATAIEKGETLDYNDVEEIIFPGSAALRASANVNFPARG